MALQWFEAPNKIVSGDDFPDISNSEEFFAFKIAAGTWYVLSNEALALPTVSHEMVEIESGGKIDPNRSISGA